jgi:riboflavin biosynthesis pyrimidine reductase
MNMLLENKVAVIYGAGGPIGGAVARAFAREGARVFLAGRTQAKLDKVAGDIRLKGGAADTAAVDALDERAVDAYVDGVVEQAGQVDISFNVIGYGDVQKPLSENDNISLINENVEEELKKLKKQPGKDIMIFASSKLVQSLTNADLIDEYRIVVHPVILGSGKRLLENIEGRHDLPLKSVTPYKSGAVMLQYVIAKK